MFGNGFGEDFGENEVPDFIGEALLSLLEEEDPFEYGVIMSAARDAVASGNTTCPCGRPDCTVGAAIRKILGEEANPSQNFMSGKSETIQQAFGQALSSERVKLGIAEAVAAGIEVHEKRKRRNVWWRRLFRFVAGSVSVAVSGAFLYIYSVVMWRSALRIASHAAELDSFMKAAGRSPGINPVPRFFTSAAYLGRRLYRTPHRFATRLKTLVPGSHARRFLQAVRA